MGFCLGLTYRATAIAHHSHDNFKATSPTQYYENETFSFMKAVDGDTLDIIDSHSQQIRIRLHGIDTPERGKFYFSQATKQLEALCKGQTIRLSTIGDGKFGRISANVTCGTIFANAALIESGAAIVSIQYANEPSFYKLQNGTRRACKGIWTKEIEKTYPKSRLEGHSPIQGWVKITSQENCLHSNRL
ncbi:MAG: thermonuclease family protein [Litorimonas sp.]